MVALGAVRATSTSTIMRYPDSMLAVMIEQENEQRSIQEGKELVIDRNDSVFKYILEYYRNGEQMVLPENADILREVKLEVEFFQLPGLKTLLAEQKFNVGDYVKMASSPGTRQDQLIRNMKGSCLHNEMGEHEMTNFLWHQQNSNYSYFGKVLQNVKPGCVIVKFKPQNEFRGDGYAFHMPQDFLKRA